MIFPSARSRYINRSIGQTYHRKLVPITSEGTDGFEWSYVLRRVHIGGVIWRGVVGHDIVHWVEVDQSLIMLEVGAGPVLLERAKAVADRVP